MHSLDKLKKEGQISSYWDAGNKGTKFSWPAKLRQEWMSATESVKAVVVDAIGVNQEVLPDFEGDVKMKDAFDSTNKLKPIEKAASIPNKQALATPEMTRAPHLAIQTTTKAPECVEIIPRGILRPIPFQTTTFARPAIPEPATETQYMSNTGPHTVEAAEAEEIREAIKRSLVDQKVAEAVQRATNVQPTPTAGA